MDQTPRSACVDTSLDAFARAQEAGDRTATAALFEPEGYWRDRLAFAWNIVTLEGRDAMAAMLDQTDARARR